VRASPEAISAATLEPEPRYVVDGESQSRLLSQCEIVKLAVELAVHTAGCVANTRLRKSKMAVPFYLLLLGTSFAIVIGLGVVSACGWYKSQQQLPGAGEQSSSSRSSHSVQTKQSNQQAMGMAISPDAFAMKEIKKQQLLEKAKRRYLELHPSFVPPMKDKSL